MTVDSAQAWYVYGVLPAAATAPSIDDAVLPGAPVMALASEAVSVLASLVPRALFDQADAANRATDPDWIAARVAGHHAVNAAACATGVCLPFGFGVMFSTLGKLTAWLAPRQATLVAALARIDGRAEWVLTLDEVPDQHAAWLDTTDPALRALKQTAASAGEGTAFLLARRRDRDRAAARRARIEAIHADIPRRAAAMGIDAAAEPPPATGPAIGAWTLLAPRAAARPCALSRALDEDLAGSGLTTRLTGPWPPYGVARALLREEVSLG